MPLWLPNLDRLQVSPGTGDGAGVIGVLGRQGHHPEVLDGEHLHRVQVDDRDHIFDGPGVAIVLRVGATQVSARTRRRPLSCSPSMP